METNTILTANILDIVFDGKNKDYGAYELRKTYNQRMFSALLITVTLIVLMLLLTLYAAPKKNGVVDYTEIKTIDPSSITHEKKKVEKDHLKLNKINKTHAATSQFTKTIFVKNTDIIPPTMNRILETVIDSKTVAGLIDSGKIQRSALVGGKTSDGDLTDKNDKNDFHSEEIEASFPGGLSAWKNYLQRNLNPDIAVENGAVAGSYTVVVSFNVSKDGTLSDIQCENDPQYGMCEEAKRIINKGPKWKPAFQNGRYVDSYHLQPITFVVEEH